MSKSVTKVLSLIVMAGLAAGSASCAPNYTAEANEIRARDRLRAINQAQLLYANSCGNGGYATSFKALRTPQAGTQEALPSPPFTDADVIDANGYRLRVGHGAGATAGPADCNGMPTTTAYYASAEPLDGGTKSFATNSGNTVWELKGSKAPTEPFAPPAMPVP